MASRRERQAGRQGGEKQFCAAAEWEQKTNGGSYIRERQNERRAAKGETLGDGEVEKNTSEIEGVKE